MIKVEYIEPAALLTKHVMVVLKLSSCVQGVIRKLVPSQLAQLMADLQKIPGELLKAKPSSKKEPRSVSRAHIVGPSGISLC